MDGRPDSHELEETDEKIDPRIQDELEKLNTFTDEINRLETELDEVRAHYKDAFSTVGPRLHAVAKKVGAKTLEKARPYYTAVREAKLAHTDTQNAARQFQRSNSQYEAAKETIALAENRLQSERNLDGAWLEMLNNATMKVTDSEMERRQSEHEHLRRASLHDQAQFQAQQLSKENKGAVKKAGLYFELRESMDDDLKAQKVNIWQKQKVIARAKKMYAEALKNLEYISDEVHRRREYKFSPLQLPQREPGVGAESDSERSSLPDIDKAAAHKLYLSEEIQCAERSLHTEDLSEYDPEHTRRRATTGSGVSTLVSVPENGAGVHNTEEHTSDKGMENANCLQVDKTQSLPRSEASGASDLGLNDDSPCNVSFETEEATGGSVLFDIYRGERASDSKDPAPTAEEGGVADTSELSNSMKKSMCLEGPEEFETMV